MNGLTEVEELTSTQKLLLKWAYSIFAAGLVWYLLFDQVLAIPLSCIPGVALVVYSTMLIVRESIETARTMYHALKED